VFKGIPLIPGAVHVTRGGQ